MKVHKEKRIYEKLSLQKKKFVKSLINCVEAELENVSRVKKYKKV